MAQNPPMNRQQRRAQKSMEQQLGPSPAYAEAIQAFQTGNYGRAQELVSQLAAQSPSNVDYWNLWALIAHAQGHLPEAANYFRKALAIAPQIPGLMNNLGLLLSQIGEHAEAEHWFRKALAIDARMEDAVSNLAQLCASTGRFEEALKLYQQATQLAPANPIYPLQIGKIFKHLGKYTEAISQYEQSMVLARVHPQWSTVRGEASLRLANALMDIGRRGEALPYYYEAIQRGVGRPAELGFAHAMASVRCHEPHPEFKPIIARALRERWIPAVSLDHAAWSLLCYEPAFVAAMHDAAKAEPASLLSEASIRTIAQDELLIALLQATAISDAPLEKLLTACRHALLVTPEPDAYYEPFAQTLALQCFANEYAFAESEEETIRVAELEVQGAQGTNPIQLAILGSYRPLHQLSCAEAIAAAAWPPSSALLLTRQLHNPREEAVIRAQIKTVTPVQDTISEAVRSMYEVNPYPRWTQAPSQGEQLSVAQWLHHYFPAAPMPEHTAQGSIDVLVAGCGTGQQSVNAALRFANANVLGVDLSTASLAYAIRQTKALGITTIEYAQGDILELGSLGRQFDIVECGGVLHHLHEPIQGWRVLAGLTKPGGYMSIALYSELARKPLIAARDYAKGALLETSQALRQFRADILALPNDNPAAFVADQRDFYTLSMLRDLLFHVQEHRYTMARLKSEIETLGLIFCGFNLSPEIAAQFHAHFGAEADLLSFDQWSQFEEAHPHTFVGMYQFLVRKP